MTDSESSEADSSRLRLIPEGEFRAIYVRWKSEIEAAIVRGEPWAIVGIKRRGALLARRLWEDLHPAHPQLLYGGVDIALYRDDYHLKGSPRVLGTEIDFSVEGVSVVLVDDVLFTGRTVRAALHQLLDFGRPHRIWLAVFVDRGHRELPIEANFVGKAVETAAEDKVLVFPGDLETPLDVVDLISTDRGEGGE